MYAGAKIVAIKNTVWCTHDANPLSTPRNSLPNWY